MAATSFSVNFFCAVVERVVNIINRKSHAREKEKHFMLVNF
jgi:hypothetical protein